MSVRVESAALVGLLTDLVQTAGSVDEDGLPCAAVLLHSTRVDRRSEPGKVDLLVGTSTDRFMVGHTWADADGQLPGPMLWPLVEVRTVIAALRLKIRGEKDSGPKHRVCLRRVGDRVEIVEDSPQRSMFGDGDAWEFAFVLASLDDYPRGLWSLLSTGDQSIPAPYRDTDGEVVEALPRADYDTERLAQFVRIAKRRAWPLQTFRRHHRLPTHIQIGWGYRGLILPVRWNEEHEDGLCPDVAVHDPKLPPPPPPPPAPKPSDPKPVDLDIEPAGERLVIDDPDLFAEAATLVVTARMASPSMLQRKLKIGHAKANRLLGELEQLGIVGPAVGTRAREVLVAEDQLAAALERLRAESGEGSGDAS